MELFKMSPQVTFCNVLGDNDHFSAEHWPLKSAAAAHSGSPRLARWKPADEDVGQQRHLPGHVCFDIS
jgi:hypothetical protein